MIRKTIFAAVTLGLLSGAANAATVFYDNFAAEPAALTVTSLTNFSVVGNVDVVLAGNPYGIITPGGTVIDLDGTTGPGALTSLASFAFNAGDSVVMSILIGGSQRVTAMDGLTGGLSFSSATSISNLNFTGVFSGSFAGPFFVTGFGQGVSIGSGAPFTLSTIGFTANSAGSVMLNISTSSADNVGPLLASVQLDITGATTVPVPGALALFGLSLLGLGFARRRA